MVAWFGRKRAPKAEPPPSLVVNLTPQAHQQLAAVLARQPRAAALRIFVKNPGGSPPQYDMALEPADMLRDGDVVIDSDGLRVLVDADSQAAVDGATVDFRDDPLQPQVQSVLVHHVNPGIAAHGGRAELVGVKDDVVYVAMGGGCQGCSMAAVTLKQGIEQILKQMIPQIRGVVDATDHAHGSNPFYTAEKGGESPFHQAAKA